MSEGTGEKEFVPVERILNPGSWADANDDEKEREINKPKQAWGPVKTSDDAPDLATIQAEEARKSEEAAAKKPYRAPQKASVPYDNSNNYERSYESRGSSDRAPRERQPVPTEPPYTAFIGNLSYEITEELLEEYFGELGVISVRLMKDSATGKPKGFGYIEFRTQDGLTNALSANNATFQNRPLNVDVAKPPSKTSNSSWGPGNRDNNSRDSNRPSFRPGDRERDTTWGPGTRDSNRPPFRLGGSGGGSGGGSSGGFGGGSGNGSSFSKSAERPKLNLNPISKREEVPREPTKPKGSAENPFGTAIIDTEKMDRIAKERLEREQERDAKKKADEDKRRDERERANKRPHTARDGGDRDNSSWRTNNNPKPSTARRDDHGPRGRDDNRGTERRTGGRQPVQVDSEGFQQPSTRSRGWEAPGSGSAARAAQNEVQSKQQNVPKPEQNTQKQQEKANRFAELAEEEL